MGSFGERLRHERELRGITLPELSEATKIGPRYLRALESDRFDQLPGGIFNRGFVRAIARYMKLDERHWMAEYLRAAHEEPEMVAHYAAPLPSSRPAHAARTGLWSFLALVAVFGVAAYLIHEVRAQRAAEASARPARTPAVPAAASQEPHASQPEAAPTNPPQPVSLPSLTNSPVGNGALPAANSSSSETVLPSTPATADLRLQIDVLEEAWVSVAVDGEPSYRGVIKPGETRNFQASDRIELITGNASAVVLTLNSETLAPLGNPGERKKIVLTAKDLRPAEP